MSQQKWWDEPAITLLAHTGDVELAEQFAAWCKQGHEDLCRVVGVDPETFDQTGMVDFIRGGNETES